jgi:hypothetical protein
VISTVDLYQLHPNQEKVRAEARRFNALNCGRRWGKTVLGVDLVAETAIDGEPAAWFAPSYKLLSEPWRELKLLLDPIIASKNETTKQLRLLTGGVVDCWSLDDPDAGRGRKYKRVVVDEAAMARALREAWPKSIRPTLTDLHGDAWFLSTPAGTDSYFRELHALADTDPDWMAWTMPTVANPLIDPAEVEAARRNLSEAQFAQEYGAAFVDTSGAAWFPRFATARHVSLDAEYEPALPVHLAVDSGVHTAAIWFQVRKCPDATRSISVFAEHYCEGRTARENARIILGVGLALCDGRRDVPTTDPAGGARNPIGPAVLDEYRSEGLHLSPWPMSSVADSLALLESLVTPADGATRLQVHPRCVRLIAAFGNYRRARRDGQWIDKPEDPQHPHEDLMDALRGGVYHALKRPVLRIGTVGEVN